MQQSSGSIKRTLKNLRTIIEESKDPLVIRMAYFAETSLRWATENTVGWKRPEDDLKDEVEFLSKELAAAEQRRAADVALAQPSE